MVTVAASKSLKEASDKRGQLAINDTAATNPTNTNNNNNSSNNINNNNSSINDSRRNSVDGVMQRCGLCSLLSSLIRRAMCVGSRRGSGESYYQELAETTVCTFFIQIQILSTHISFSTRKKSFVFGANVSNEIIY